MRFRNLPIRIKKFLTSELVKVIVNNNQKNQYQGDLLCISKKFLTIGFVRVILNKIQKYVVKQKTKNKEIYYVECRK
jgi:hypothetical protein